VAAVDHWAQAQTDAFARGTLALALLGTFHFILVPVRITGKSMEPAYRDKSVNLINLFAYRNSKPKRGDVVGVKTTGVSTMFFKRVIALPRRNGANPWRRGYD
jgi:signal peptidase I